MSSFLHNIIQRHTPDAAQTAQPRLPGIFEQGALSIPTPQETNVVSEPEIPYSPPGSASPLLSPLREIERTKRDQRPNKGQIHSTTAIKPDSPVVQPVLRQHSLLHDIQEMLPAQGESRSMQTFEVTTLPQTIVEKRTQTIDTIMQHFSNQETRKKITEGHLSPVMLHLLNQSAATLQSNPVRDLPTVKIHIGRIEIKAVPPPAPPPKHTVETPKVSLSLEDYLKARKG